MGKGSIVRDFNNDGKPDIAMTDSKSRNIAVFLNQTVGKATVLTKGNKLNASGSLSRLDIDLPQQKVSMGGERWRTEGISQVIGSRANDKIIGDSQKNNLFGSDGNDIISGQAGDDLIAGGLGNDRLTGGSGKDKFLLGKYRPELHYTMFDLVPSFPTTPYLPEYGYDVITDFDPDEDLIAVSTYWFNSAKSNSYMRVDPYLEVSFAIAPNLAMAKRSAASIVYVPKNGGVYYNKNRSKQGFEKGGLIADLQDGLQLSRRNFVTTFALDSAMY
jgi:Ca2+-binding RTX toxin-like protein